MLGHQIQAQSHEGWHHLQSHVQCGRRIQDSNKQNLSTELDFTNHGTLLDSHDPNLGLSASSRTSHVVNSVKSGSVTSTVVDSPNHACRHFAEWNAHGQVPLNLAFDLVKNLPWSLLLSVFSVKKQSGDQRKLHIVV